MLKNTEKWIIRDKDISRVYGLPFGLHLLPIDMLKVEITPQVNRITQKHQLEIPNT